jgi:PAS domain S-box-containing protein
VAERAQALRATAALLQTVTDNASVGLVTLDHERRYVFANPAYCRILGLPNDILGRHPAEVLSPAYAEQIAPLLDRAFAGERISSELNQSPVVGAGGQANHYSVIYEPERDANGDITGVVVVVFDITERKRAEEHVRLLLNEVNHRSKNMLSVVLAIAQQTIAPSSEDFVQRFSNRVQALAASHDLLVKNQWQSIGVADLVRAQLAHFADLMERRIVLDGPPLHLSVAGAQSIGMVVHELATNAAKHGALSNQDGHVEITWQLNNGAAGERFMMTWIERSGPPVAGPTHRGFGSTVVTSMAELSLDGATQLDFAASGLVWRLACPATKILDTGDICTWGS